MKKVLLFILCPFFLFGQTQIGQDINGDNRYDSFGTSVSTNSNGRIIAIGATGSKGNFFGSGSVGVYEFKNNIWTQIGKDINGDRIQSYFGVSVSLSSDGTIVAIGGSENYRTGISGSGYVCVYEFKNNVWTQIGIDIDGEFEGDESGSSVSLSSDGTIVAIGAQYNNGNGGNSGHVRVYEFKNNIWTQIGIDIDGEFEGDESGSSVSLSSDGTIVAIGAQYNNGNGGDSGHVRVYEFKNNIWTQIGIDIDGESGGDESGSSVSLSSDGTIVAIGAEYNNGNSTDSGHVRVYEFKNNVWIQLGIDIDGELPWDYSGVSVSLSSDGTIVAIGGINRRGNVNPNGHVRIYKYINNKWNKIGTDIDGEFIVNLSGYSTNINSDGTILVIGDYYNNKNGEYSGQVRIYDINIPLSAENENIFNFSMNPNPTKDKFNIELPHQLIIKKIEVFNSLGLLIKTTQEKEIVTTNFASGIYYVRIITDKGKSVKKLVIE